MIFCSIRVRKSGSIEVMQSKKRLFPCDEDGSEGADLSELNPWITHCHKRGIDKMKTAQANSSPQSKYPSSRWQCFNCMTSVVLS